MIVIIVGDPLIVRLWRLIVLEPEAQGGLLYGAKVHLIVCIIDIICICHQSPDSHDHVIKNTY